MLYPTVVLDIVRTDAGHPALKGLIALLDEYLAQVNGEEAQSYYGQFNSLRTIPYFVIVMKDGDAVGCGAMKEFDPASVEIKRMFVRPEVRGLRIGSKLLASLEAWAGELGYRHAVLETGKVQKEAVRLYERSGYQVIANYGQYEGLETSVCMRKALGR